ncbi:MAG: 23S rRNA (uracil(1939)-C(5))-methyltransferase RlmD, partial [Clostridia bacterium]|nr:23S rRNA (uracil(1939)-C(5))-methyltransferase RlmD [Clostridia bacterium]
MNCPIADKGCGGCREIGARYGDLLKAKNEAFRRLFPGAEPIVGAENPRGYRNKVLRSFANGKTSLYHGIYRAGTHQIV